MALIEATSSSWKALELSWTGGVINAEPAGWKLPGFNDAAWPAAYVPPDPPMPPWYDIAGADFILAGAARTNNRLQGAVFAVRKEFTVVTPPVGAVLTATADNFGDFYLDGTYIGSIPAGGAFEFTVPHVFPVDASLLTAGTHCLAIVGTNGAVGIHTWASNPTMVQARLDTSEAVGWDAYAAATPNGDIVATIQNDAAPVEGATERSIRVALKETGSGTFKINRHSALATEAVVARGNCVKVRLPWRSDYDFAFFLENGDFTLLHADEEGGEVFTFGGRGILAYLSRAVMDAVAYTTGLDVSDKLVELWRTNKVPKPVGIAFVPSEPAYVYVIGETTRRVYKIRQSDRVVVATSPALWAGSTHYAVGLTADPSDATILWALEAPWLSGSTAHTKIHKVRRSDWSILTTLDLGSAVHLTDLRASTSDLYTTNYSTDKIEKRSKTTGSVTTSWTVVYNGVNQVNPNGVGISENGTGTEIAMWFGGTGAGGVKKALVANLSNPAAVTRTINTKDIASYGGDWSQESGSDYFYMVSVALGLTWKYQLTTATPHDPVDLIWRLDEEKPGAVLWRVIQEALDAGRPQEPFPDLTIDFDQTTDSNSDTWDDHDGTTEFDAAVTEEVLSVALRLIPYGLIEKMSPRLLLQAFNASTYGTDRTGAFALDKVRFEKGVNIIPELGRQERERELHSHMLATGKDGIYARATLNDLGYVREGGIQTDLEDATALAGTADAELDNERVLSERIRFAVPIANDPANGSYLPFTHYDVGDLVTLHTGSGEHDFNEETFVLYAITLAESPSGHFEQAILELGSATLIDTPAPGGTTGGGGGSGMGGGGTVVSPASITVQGLDDTGAVVTSASGRTIRSSDFAVSQAGSGVIELALNPDSLPDDDTGGILPGDITVDGTPFAVTTGSTHKAFPSGAWMTNPDAAVHGVGDKLLIVHRDGDDHLNNGSLMGIIATCTSRMPFTATLGSPFVIENVANDLRPQGPGISVLDIDGTGDFRVILTLDEYNMGGAVNTAVHVLVSDVASDLVTSSTTWTRHNVGAPLTGHTQDTANGRMFKLADGTFLMGAQYAVGATVHTVVLKSADVTFASPTMVEVTTSGYNEMGLVVLPDGVTVRGHLRNTAQTTISGVVSTDGGLTWSAPTVLWNGGGFPTWFRLPSGNALATGRTPSPNYDTGWWWTASGDTDDGWSSATTLSTALDHGAYGDIIQIDNNQFLILYADETGEAVPLDANIAWQVATDASVFATEGTVRVSEADTTPGFLEDKLVAGTGVLLTKLGTGSDESLRVDSTAAPTFGTPAIVLGTAAADGVVDEVIRRDATIVAFDATTPAALTVGGAGAVGSAAKAARRDHAHPMPSAADIAAALGGGHVHVVAETHLSDGSTTTYVLDQAFEPGSVEAFNTTALAYLTVTETAPDQATVSAAGSSGDKITFSYAGSLA